MSKLQAIRDSFERGDDVFVMGHGHAPRRARIVEVLRGAVRVRYADRDRGAGEVQTVLFKNLKRIVDEPERAPDHVQDQIVHALKTIAPLPAAAQESPRSAADGFRGDELDVWLDMGRDMAARMRTQIESLEQAEIGLRADAKELFQLAEQAGRDRAELQRKLQAVIAITSSAEAVS